MINIIHQTSKTKNLTPFQQKSKESILNVHKGVEYKLWDDNDLLVKSLEEFPGLSDIWDKIEGIQRADLGRYMVLYLEGGLYADTDVIFEKNFFKNLKLDKGDIYFSPSVRIFPWNKLTMTNYIIYASEEKMILFKDLINEGIKRIKNSNKNSIEYVPYTTGRILVNDISEKYKNNIKKLSEDKIINKFCSSTKISEDNICYHEGSTIRSDEDGSWRSSTIMNIVDTECNLRKNLGVKGNVCQAPIIIISIVLSIIAIISYILFIRR